MEETNEIQEKISQRIRQREAGKEFKDTSVVNYTRKYSASYDIVTSQDLTKIEADNVTAYKLIEKSKIWPAYNIEELKQAGNTSGAAYLKVKCRESLGSRPIDSKDARETYVRNIEKLRLQLESGKTFEEVSGILKSFVNLDAFEFGKLPDNLRSSNYISTTYTGNLKTFYRRDVEDYFSKIFGKRFYSFCDGSSDFSKKSGVESRLIERFTKEMEDAAVLQRENQLNKRVSEYERMIEAVTNAEDNRDSIRTAIYSINKYAGVSRYEKQFVLDELKKQIASSKKTLLSVRENLPAYFKAREDDWSWAGIKKEKKAAEKKDSLDVVAKAPESIFEKYGIEDWKKKSKRTPLSHIKRTGGLTVDSVQVNEVVDKFGFKNVVFGNYVNNEERREHLKHFLGALLDLHEIINFDIKEINGLGGLDINFGSTGCGSFSNAMACYFPALKAINLTKKRGDGSIAHEWSHYLDNVIGEGTERRAKDSIYATYLKTIYKDSEKVKILFSEFKNWLHTGGKKRPVFVKFYPQRKYMFRMYGDTVELAVDAIQKKYPTYRKYENADTPDLLKYYGYVAYKLNDGKPIVVELETSASEYYYVSSLYNDGTGYWTSIKELFARAFEWFVEDALVLQKRSNNYLVDTTNALGLLALIIPYNQHPYPRTPEDQSFLRDWFDRLFSAIRTEYNIKPFHWDTTEREDEFSQYAPGDTEKIETGVVVDSEGDTEGLGAEIEEFEKGYSFRRIIKDGKTIYHLLLKHAPQNVLVSKLTKSGWDIYKLSDEGETIKLHETSFGKLKDAQLFVVNNDITDTMPKIEIKNKYDFWDNLLLQHIKPIISKYNWSIDKYAGLAKTTTYILKYIGDSQTNGRGEFEWTVSQASNIESGKEHLDISGKLILTNDNWENERGVTIYSSFIESDDLSTALMNFEDSFIEAKKILEEVVQSVDGISENDVVKIDYSKTNQLIAEFSKLVKELSEANDTQVKSRIVVAGENLEKFIKEHPQYYPEFFNAIIKLPKKYRFGTNPYRPAADMEYNFPGVVEWLSSTNTNLFSIIPVKEYDLPKYRPVDTTHEDKTFIKIHSEFTGTDDLRPVMMGINFNESGAVSTNAHLMLFTPYRSKAHKPYGNFCFTKKCFEQEQVVESGRFPQWRQVIPKETPYKILIDAKALFNFLKNSIELQILPETTKSIAFYYPENEHGYDRIGFNAVFLLKVVEAMVQLGHKEIELSFSSPNRGAIVYPSTKHGHVEDLTTDFALIMPVHLGEGYGVCNMNYNFETNCCTFESVSETYCFEGSLPKQKVEIQLPADEPEKTEPPTQDKPKPVSLDDYKSALDGAETALEFAEEVDKQNLIDYIEGLKVVIETMQN